MFNDKFNIRTCVNGINVIAAKTGMYLFIKIGLIYNKLEIRSCTNNTQPYAETFVKELRKTNILQPPLRSGEQSKVAQCVGETDKDGQSANNS